MVSLIDKISPISKIDGSDKAGKASLTGAAAGSFGSMFKSLFENVAAADAEKSKYEYQLAVGELDNPALLTIASSKYQIAVDLMLQLRSKALDAYSELTRINL